MRPLSTSGMIGYAARLDDRGRVEVRVEPPATTAERALREIVDGACVPIFTTPERRQPTDRPERPWFRRALDWILRKVAIALVCLLAVVLTAIALNAMPVTDISGNTIENARVGCLDERVDTVDNLWTGDGWECGQPTAAGDPPCVVAPDWIPWEGETLALVCVDLDAGPGFDVSELTVVYVPEPDPALALAVVLVVAGALVYVRRRR